jgi:tRNA(Ile2) C34 agmatinyltransferase TiaS
MAENKSYYSIEITDIYEPEQEDFVIEKVKGILRKDYDELKKYFKETDSLRVKKLTEEKAKSLAEELEAIDVKVEIIGDKKTKKAEKPSVIKCPKCGSKLEYMDWRCPECFYEFPEYDFKGEDETEEPEGSSS